MFSVEIASRVYFRVRATGLGVLYSKLQFLCLFLRVPVNCHFHFFLSSLFALVHSSLLVQVCRLNLRRVSLSWSVTFIF